MDTTVNFFVTLFFVLLLVKGLDKLGLLSLFSESGDQVRRRREAEMEFLRRRADEIVRNNNQRRH
ncbi:MAG: hypothetical protein VB138_02710 [Burkholderia sp.]